MTGPVHTGADAIEMATEYDEPLPLEYLAEIQADLDAGAHAAPSGRSFTRDFRGRSMLTSHWQAVKASRTKRSPARSTSRARRRPSRPAASSRLKVIGIAPVDAEPPASRTSAPQSPPRSPTRPAGSSRHSATDLPAPPPLESAATHEVVALTHRERRLIDFLVDEALNEWLKQNSRA